MVSESGSRKTLPSSSDSDHFQDSDNGRYFREVKLNVDKTRGNANVLITVPVRKYRWFALRVGIESEEFSSSGALLS